MSILYRSKTILVVISCPTRELRVRYTYIMTDILFVNIQRDDCIDQCKQQTLGWPGLQVSMVVYVYPAEMTIWISAGIDSWDGQMVELQVNI